MSDSSRLIKDSRLPAYVKSKQKPHANLLLGLAICLYLLAVACWAIDVALLRQELYVLLPNQVSPDPDPHVYEVLAKLRGAEKYAQAVLQVVIVSSLPWQMRSLLMYEQWSISDCITLWRAYAILERPRWLRITILFVLFFEFGVSSVNNSHRIAQCCADGTPKAGYVVYLTLYLYALSYPPRFIAILWRKSEGLIGTAPFAATSSVTATVQFFATSLIAFKAW